jgi:hypothetical protein
MPVGRPLPGAGEGTRAVPSRRTVRGPGLFAKAKTSGFRGKSAPLRLLMRLQKAGMVGQCGHGSPRALPSASGW